MLKSYTALVDDPSLIHNPHTDSNFREPSVLICHPWTSEWTFAHSKNMHVSKIKIIKHLLAERLEFIQTLI